MKINRRRFMVTTSALTGGLLLSQCAPNNSDNQVDAPVVKNPGPKKDKYDAIVIGAGLSGLHAASILEDAGLDVLVLEGRNRLGGRVYTLEDVPGKPEAAGEYIGANYARMINTVRKHGLEMYNPENNGPNRPWLYQINGEWITGKDWPNHALNPLTGEDRSLLPHQMLSKISHKDNPLADQPLDAWLKPEFQKYDIPHDDYLRGLGWNEETIRLMNVIIHSGGIHKTSAINELRRYHVNSFNSKLSFPDGNSWKMVKGGNSLLPRKMAESLSNEVLLNKTVVSFKESNGGVDVHCADGETYRADNVVCSIPISVLRNVTFEPHITGVGADAIQQMAYGLSVQVHYLVTDNYWEKDGMEPTMWTDGPLERIALRTRQDDSQPHALIVYINGPESLRFRLMNDDEVFAYTETQLAKLRPSMKGALKRLLIQSCERDIHGAGDWVYWQPGQVTKFGNNMRLNHGRIRFCGEHTAIMERGMEGAFESGERAAMDIVLNS